MKTYSGEKPPLEIKEISLSFCLKYLLEKEGKKWMWRGKDETAKTESDL